MTDKVVRNIDESEWTEGKDSSEQDWRYIDLSGDRLGVRLEEISPGGSSSIHHFHTQEEEHVIMLEGNATLILGSEEYPLKTGDHMWFEAGVETAHHIENRTSDKCKFLVFGERNDQDIVMYPEHKVMIVKALASKQFTYREIDRSNDESE